MLHERATIRDRHTGVRRAIGPGDIGVLFRTRESHALFEAALAKRDVPFYVYKGLGFFDAEEIKDVLALVSYLADPFSNLRAAALLRSRIVRISDAGLKILAPDLAGAIAGGQPAAADQLAEDDRERLRLILIRERLDRPGGSMAAAELIRSLAAYRPTPLRSGPWCGRRART